MKYYLLKFRELLLGETTLFDDKHLSKRIDKEYQKVKSTNHHYYNSLKEDLSNFFMMLPQKEKDSFKKEITNEFKDRVYELVIYRLFKNQCYKVKLHRGKFKGNTKPDFEITKWCSKLYAEVKNVYDLTKVEKSVDYLESKYVEEIDKIDNQYFFIKIKELYSKSLQQTSPRKLVRSIKDVIDQYQEQDLKTIYEQEKNDDEYFPKIEYEDENVKFKASVHLRLKNRWSIKSNGFTGTRHYNTIYGDAKDSIRSALKKKATKYG